MDKNQIVAIIALIVALLMILAAIGIFVYEVRTEWLPSFNLSEFVLQLQSRLREKLTPASAPPQTPLPATSSPQIANPTSTLLPIPDPIEPEYDTVFFGHYEQGNGIEPIEWYVLEKREDRCLLISRYVLDYLKYHGTREPVTWETCGLRAWLNKEFLEIAFLPEELSGILVTEVDNSVGNPIFHTEGGNNTEDRVFLLSREEVEAYFPQEGERRCQPTEAVKNYAVAGYSHWWLRTPGITQDQAEYVHFSGGFIDGNVNLNFNAIRPVMWVASGSLP